MATANVETHRSPDIIKVGNRLFRRDSRLNEIYFIEAGLVVEAEMQQFSDGLKAEIAKLLPKGNRS